MVSVSPNDSLNVVDNTNPESKNQDNDTPNSAYDPTTGFGYGYCNKYVYDDGDKIFVMGDDANHSR